jgi:preprotein translocase subunit SecA
MVTNAIEKAQRKVEGRNFDIRKQLLEFDDVNNEQRKVIYHMRNTLLAADNIGETIADFRQDVLNATVSAHIPPQSLPEQWDVAGLEAALQSDFGVALPIQQWLDEDDHLYEETLREKLMQELVAAYNEKEDQAGAEALRTFEKQIVLRVLDDLWKDHLSTMDHLRHGIHLRGYAQKNPKQEYKRESFTLFSELLDSIKRDSIRVLSHVQVRREDPAEEEARLRQEAEALAARMQFQHAEAPGLEQPEALGERSMWPWPPHRYATSRSWAATSCATAVRARNSSIATGRFSNPVSNAEIPAPRPAPAVAAFCHYTTALPEAVHTSSIRSAFMAVGLGPLPTLHPVAGFELGIARPASSARGARMWWSCAVPKARPSPACSPSTPFARRR